MTPEDNLDEVLQIMVKDDIGRLPIMEGDNLIGIVTRSDLLRILYRNADSLI